MNNSISEFNKRFPVRGVSFSTIDNGMVFIEITNSHASAKLALHGAHVMSYTPAGDKDLLWMSNSSWFTSGKPIRGGIPVCWPWFGSHPTDPELPSHGFARLTDWQIKSIELADNDIHTVVLEMQDSENSRKSWNFAFNLELIITVGSELRVELITYNCDTKAFEISTALHNYFSVKDISRTEVSGLDSCTFLDTVDNIKKIQHGPVTFTAETDNTYLDTDATTIIHDQAGQRQIAIAKEGSKSTVVWNPWIAKASRMPDFGDDEYTGMLCVETTNAENDSRTIAPGDQHRIATILSAR